VPVKPPEPVKTEEMDDGFVTVNATIRGTRYVLRELPADDYQKCQEGAINADGMVDNVTMLKLMLAKAVVEPKLTAVELFKRPYPVIRKLNDIINDMHFTPIETDEEKAEEEDDGEGKAEA
jgi:hypothetical protein